MMEGVLEGFAVIFLVVAVGFVLGRLKVLGPDAQQVISRLVFSAGTPALLFVTLTEADLDDVISPSLAVTVICTTAIGLFYAAVARWWLRRRTGDMVIGALASSYVNAGNLGIPLTVFVLGDAAYVAPVMLYQVVFMAPVAYAVLDLDAKKVSGPVWKQLLVPLRNPITVGSGVGLLVSGLGIQLPDLIHQPIELVAGLAVPGALIAFGLSLSTGWRTSAPSPAVDLTLITVLKLVVHPVLTFVVGHFVFGLTGTVLFAVCLFAALPTAQNVLIAAIRYNRAVGVARQAALITTALSILPMVLIATVIPA
ncbi:AEC family transporter [Arthrobacter castelli]|uniref:AEC family transporter n=1 Tax=Arthrobacter castelli TaxID=271431 RepID=UPI001B7FDA61|nr:AEC family transporter [Arthrobacter castelli]